MPLALITASKGTGWNQQQLLWQRLIIGRAGKVEVKGKDSIHGLINGAMTGGRKNKGV